MSFHRYNALSTNISRYNREYDIFLSFRGKDVRKSFVDHLYAALHTAALNVFLDNKKLKRGEIIGLSLEAAIHGSHILISIFSTNYAHSSWCLNEVLEMTRSGNIIIPLFYNVQPSDLRYPEKANAIFAPAFQKHRSRSCGEEIIGDWKSALNQAASFSGWTMESTNGYEADLVKLVVRDVLKTFNNVPLHVQKFAVGLEKPMDYVIELLEMGALMVGICGVGGVGKTTLAKAIFNRLNERNLGRFEGASFVSNVRVRSQQGKGISDLQMQLLKDVLKESFEVNDESHGKALMKTRLRHIKSLVVLDDVDHLTQLEALAGDCLGSDSRVIVTSRDQCLFKHGEPIYPMKGLQNDEALKLFSWLTFSTEYPPEDWQHFSKRVVSACHGLPLSLEVLGAYLCNKRDRVLWEESLLKLKNAKYKDIHGSLRISYEGLEDEEKEIFLDIACFFSGQKREAATISFWEASFSGANTALTNLIHKSLIRLGQDRFEMHDHLVELGTAIATERRSRLWKEDDVKEILEERVGIEDVQFLCLDAYDEPSLQTECFASLRRLKVLWLRDRTNITGDFKYLYRNLRWVRWKKCPLKCLPCEWSMEQMIVLQLSGSDFEELWDEKRH